MPNLMLKSFDDSIHTDFFSCLPSTWIERVPVNPFEPQVNYKHSPQNHSNMDRIAGMSATKGSVL